MPADQTANRLRDETSPYLLQHAHNPVDWYPWGAEALDRARREDRPILLSIGYSACHWCHVMERESFENEATAALMNEHFVCVKVDREERPDLDEIYMAATIAIAGSGGWPMTVFLTPRQQPFFAGTYFPPRDVPGRPGFPTVLRGIADLWRSSRDRLLRQADSLTRHLELLARPARPLAVGQEEIDRAVRQLAQSFDREHGGFGPAPKFPAAMSLELLLRHHRRSGDQQALQMATVTLDAMARGGLRDHLGGGFARYSTDARWLVPHFEKMLYDNALLAKVYAEAYQVTGSPLYRRVARETLDYLVREMQSQEGGFCSATDADSEGVEGKFFVWTPAEVHRALPAEQARALCATYDVTEAGNWEGASILHTPRPLREVALELGCSVAELEALLEPARAALYEVRAKRVPPLLDDKILTGWNGLAISALAEGCRILAEPRYRDAAVRAADFILTRLSRDGGKLLRTYRAGQAHLSGVLEDYAYLCDSLIDLYEAGAEIRWLRAARDLARTMVDSFRDRQSGGFCSTAEDHEALIVRLQDGQDGATPAANAVAARALARLSFHLGDEELREIAAAAVAAHGAAIAKLPRAFAASLRVVDLLLEGPLEIAVAAGAGEDAIHRELARHFLPNRLLIRHGGGAASLAPAELLAGKAAVGGQATAYICREQHCLPPVIEPAELAAALEGAGRAAARARRPRPEHPAA